MQVDMAELRFYSPGGTLVYTEPNVKSATHGSSPMSIPIPEGGVEVV